MRGLNGWLTFLRDCRWIAIVSRRWHASIRPRHLPLHPSSAIPIPHHRPPRSSSPLMLDVHGLLRGFIFLGLLGRLLDLAGRPISVLAHAVAAVVAGGRLVGDGGCELRVCGPVLVVGVGHLGCLWWLECGWLVEPLRS